MISVWTRITSMKRSQRVRDPPVSTQLETIQTMDDLILNYIQSFSLWLALKDALYRYSDVSRSRDYSSLCRQLQSSFLFIELYSIGETSYKIE